MAEKYVYYCPNCNIIFFYDTDQPKPCGNCGESTVSLGQTNSEWTSKSPQQRDEIKENCRAKYTLEREKTVTETCNVKEGIKTLSAHTLEEIAKLNDIYEYKVVTIQDDYDGNISGKRIQDTLNDYASLGWRLKSAITNELGKNEFGVAVTGVGSGTNATIDNTVLIFERRILKR